MIKNNLTKEKKQLMVILISFSFFSLSRGLWYNYQTLWLKDNNLSTTTISSITGLASLLSVSVMFIFSNLITKKIMKKFISTLIFLKIVMF